MANKVTTITQTGRSGALVGGLIGLLIPLFVRFVTGSPWTVIHRFSAGEILPPLWFLGLLWFALPTLCGLAAGGLWAELHHAAEREASFWRGCTCLVLSLMCASAWYALLFGKCSLFFSWLCLLAAAVLSVLCAISWKGLSGGASLLVAGNALWSLILLFFQLTVVLCA